MSGDTISLEHSSGRSEESSDLREESSIVDYVYASMGRLNFNNSESFSYLMVSRNTTPLGEFGEFLIGVGEVIILVGASACLVDAIVNRNNSRVVKFGNKLLTSIVFS